MFVRATSSVGFEVDVGVAAQAKAGAPDSVAAPARAGLRALARGGGAGRLGCAGTSFGITRSSKLSQSSIVRLQTARFRLYQNEIQQLKFIFQHVLSSIFF